MAKRKISLIGLVVVMICVLVFAPVVTAGIYFIHTVSGQLQHTASETVSMYLNEFTDRTDRMMETLRDGVYYLLAAPSLAAIAAAITATSSVSSASASSCAAI